MLPMSIHQFPEGLPRRFLTKHGVHASHIDFMRKQFERRVAEGVDIVIPSFMMVWEDRREVGFCPGMWGDEEEKIFVLTQIKAVFAMRPPSRYSMYSETWIATREDGDGKEGLAPSDDPDHLDGMMVVTVERDDPQVLMTTWLVEDDCRLVQYKDDIMTGYSGVMTTLMGDRNKAQKGYH